MLKAPLPTQLAEKGKEQQVMWLCMMSAITVGKMCK